METNRQAVQVEVPNWLHEKAELQGMRVMVEAINAELKRDPKMSLAEFAKNLDKSFMEVSNKLLMKTVYAQFDKE